MRLEEFSLLSNLYKFFCILSVYMRHALGVGVINAFKHDWEKTKVQLVTTNEILKEHGEGAERTWNLREKKAKVSFHAYQQLTFQSQINSVQMVK